MKYPRPRLDRLIRHIAIGDGCWQWMAGRTRDGYARFQDHLEGRWVPRLAHRVVYELLVGGIPEGLTLDHLCRNRSCVNPSHLEPVPNRVNVLRGVSFSAVNAAKRTCVAGHDLTDTNVYLWRGVRICRTCRRKTDAKRRQSRRSVPTPTA